MYVEVAEVSRHESGALYVLVLFWHGKAQFDLGLPPAVSNDFIMQINRRYQRIVTNTDGWLKRLDGVFVDPANLTEEDEKIGFEREMVTKTNAELRQEVRQHIIDYWRRYKQAFLSRKPFPRKHDQREKMRRNQDDADGVLARVRAMQGTREEVAGE